MRPIPLVLNRRTALRTQQANVGSARLVPLLPPRATDAEVLRPLPRRIPHMLDGPEFDSPREARYQPETLERTPFIFFRRFAAWSWFFTAFFGGNALQMIIGRSSRRRRAARLRHHMEKLGTTAIKIGQLLTVYVHRLPVEYSDEMSKLFDSVEAMPTDEAIAIIEESQGRPIRELFSTFDPVPLAGGAIACVYQAVLLTGERVAVKVRRPGIERSFRADFYVLRMFHRMVEFIGIAQNNQTAAILSECQRMIADEMDLRLEARQIEAFRNSTKDLRKIDKEGIEFVTAPRVYPQFTCPQVLVTEVARGISVREILNAIQKGDGAHLTRLHELGYDFRQISKRLLHLFYWQSFEAMVFHADLHPGNIFVIEDQRLMLVDFGCCGTLPAKYRRNIFGFMKSVGDRDLPGVVRHVVGLNEPLPPIDVQRYMFDMTTVMRDYLVNAHSNHVPWQERCNLNAFRLAQQLSERYRVPLRPELLRYFRSIRHIDFMVYRLDPKLDGQKQFRKYCERRAKASRRNAKHALRDTIASVLNNLLVDAESLTRTAMNGLSRLQDFADSAGFEFGTALKKLPYVLATISSAVLRGAVIVMLIAGVKTAIWEYNQPADHMLDFWDHLLTVAHSYTIEALMVFFGMTALAKIVWRLRQADIED